MLKKRQTVIEKFSQLLDVQEDSQRQLIIVWRDIPVLKKDMNLQMESCPIDKINFWLRYWLSEARSSNSVPLAAQHLHAALQE